MECPYCHRPVPDGAETCPSCQLSYERLSSVLGPVPVLEQPVGDTTGELTPRNRKALAARIEGIERRFPQVRVRIVLRYFAEEHPLTLSAFWLFNSGQFCRAAESDGDNRTLLLILDPQSQRAALAPGYGLEVFFGPRTLDTALAAGKAAWSAGKWQQGCLAILDQLEQQLATIARQIEAGFGILPTEEAREANF
ncbi:putative membrane protein YgcG [Haloferula luteola]|uniref:Putative membrane protein YgcG n=1 Tax=Haloferula luteola TaxID=595692 RepID=A0A840V9G2_9BACT|nr:TPM domain-containing protein [Haloferula luteola]MBB5352224.1 putative membrane protein YgcG [Haloferula luteola]